MPIAPENRHRYPADWESRIRPAILRRAGLRCECEGECGRGHWGERCPERHLQPSVRGRNRHLIVLTIAHLNHRPEDDDPDVLKAMCQGCHLHYDRDHHDQSKVERFQRGIEDAGHLTLFAGDAFAVARNAVCPPSPAARVEASPPGAGDESPAALSDDALRALTVLRLPDEVRAGLEAAIALHVEYEAAGALVRATLAGALAEAIRHGAAVKELVIAAEPMTKPRLYRLLKAAKTARGVTGAAGLDHTEGTPA